VLTRWHNTSTHLREGEARSANPVLPSLKWLIRLCLDRPHTRYCRWTRPLTPSWLLGTIADLGRSKSELMAENALLRQQLVMLKRRVKRPACTKADRLLLVLLAPMVRTWKQALVLVQPETLLRWHRQGFRLFWRQKSKATSTHAKVSAEIMALIKEMAKNNRRLRSGTDPGRVTETRYPCLQTDNPEVHAGRAYTLLNGAKLADVSAYSWGRDLGLRRASR
jgi:hypothetical protein